MADDFKIQPEELAPNYIPLDELLNWDNIAGINKAADNATRNKIFAQNNAPTEGYSEGDLWFDTDDGNTAYRADSTLAWVSVQDGSIAPGITTFAQDSVPTALAAGDIWIDTDDDNKIYRATAAGDDEIGGGEWIEYRDPVATILGDTIQYTVQDAGIFSFGDGSDGDITYDGSTTILGVVPSSSVYTLDRDIYAENMTVNSGVKIKTNGYRIFCSISLTNNGTIERNGNDGTIGVTASGVTGGAGGAGGPALADGYLKGTTIGAAGGPGATGSVNNPGGSGSAGVDGTDTGTGGSPTRANSIGEDGTDNDAGKAGDGGDAFTDDANPDLAGGTQTNYGGVGGTVAASNVKLIANWHLATLLDISSTGSTVKFNTSADAGGGSGGASGGGGGGAAGGGGGGGGGAGSAGGILAIYAKVITNGATGIISTTGGQGGGGGVGGDGQAMAGGGNAGTGSGGGGQGGGGGGGGETILIYNELTNSGSISATGGVGGTGGVAGAAMQGGGVGTTGDNGTAGSGGRIRQFQISL